MNVSLTGKTAVVCGSTQGIGLATAKELSLLGAQCILLARDQNALEQAVKELPAGNGQVHAFAVADFTMPEQVQKAIETVTHNQTVHILVNNSGGPPAGPIINATSSDFLKGMTQHLLNNHYLVQAVLPGMQKENYGRIINIISTSVKVPLKNLGVSNTVRHAVAAWAKSLANEIGAFDITINNVLPGFTDTARLTSLVEHTAASLNKTVEAVRESMQQEVPLKRFGRADEIAAVAAFLATPAASYINGASIPVDGGRTGSI